MEKRRPGRPRKERPVPVDQKNVKGPLSPVITTLQDVIDAKKPPIDIHALANEFHKQIGGDLGFVERVLKEYEDTKPGSLARARIMEIMVRLFQIASPKEKTVDLGLLSDDDLAKALKNEIERSKIELKKASRSDPLEFIWDSCV
jgi:hypothetical protein